MAVPWISPPPRLAFEPFASTRERGFFLNGGRHVEIQGVANHQDFAGVGIAVPDSLQAWRVQQLKRMGCNGWRTAHNPPSEELLYACDRLGMLVMDENRHLGEGYLNQQPPGNDMHELYDPFHDDMIQRRPKTIPASSCGRSAMKKGCAAARRAFACFRR